MRKKEGLKQQHKEYTKLIGIENLMKLSLDAARSIATLQRAQVQNERLKLNARKEAGTVHTALKKLKQQVYEEIGKNHPEVAKEIIKIADEIEKEADK